MKNPRFCFFEKKKLKNSYSGCSLRKIFEKSKFCGMFVLGKNSVKNLILWSLVLGIISWKVKFRWSLPHFEVYWSFENFPCKKCIKNHSLLSGVLKKKCKNPFYVVCLFSIGNFVNNSYQKSHYVDNFGGLILKNNS